MSTPKFTATLLLVYLLLLCQSFPAALAQNESDASYGTVSFGNSLSGSDNDDDDVHDGSNVQWAFFEFLPGDCGSSKISLDSLHWSQDPFVRYVVTKNGTVRRIHQVGTTTDNATATDNASNPIIRNETAALTCSTESIHDMFGPTLQEWRIVQLQVLLSPQVGCHNYCSGRIEFVPKDPLQKMQFYSAVYDKGSLLCNNGDLFLLAGNLAYHPEAPNVKFFMMARSKSTGNQTLDSQLNFKGLAGTFPSMTTRYCSLPFYNSMEVLHSELFNEALLEASLQDEVFKNESSSSLRPPLPPKMWRWGCGLEVSRPVQAVECPNNECRLRDGTDFFKKGGAEYPNLPQWAFLNFQVGSCDLDLEGLQPESLYVFQWDPNAASTVRPRSYSVERNSTKCSGIFGYMSIARDTATNLKQVDFTMDFETCQGRATVVETIRSNAVVEESTQTQSTEFRDAILLCNDGITFSLLAKRPAPAKEGANATTTTTADTNTNTTSLPLPGHYFLNYAATSGDAWDDNANGFTAARSFFPCESNQIFCQMDLFETMTTLQSVLQNPKYFVENLWGCSGQIMVPPNFYNNSTSFDNTANNYNSNVTKPPIAGDPTTIAPSATSMTKPSSTSDTSPSPTPEFSYSITIQKAQSAPASANNNLAPEVSSSNTLV